MVASKEKLSVHTRKGGGLYLSTGAYLGHEGLYPGIKTMLVKGLRAGMDEQQITLLASAWMQAWTHGEDEGRQDPY